MSKTNKNWIQKDHVESFETPSDRSITYGSIQKYRYYDQGFCKHNISCRYFRAKNMCKEYLGGRKCDRKSCKDRHPKNANSG